VTPVAYIHIRFDENGSAGSKVEMDTTAEKCCSELSTYFK
jgi:hypothetical protein